MNSISPAPLSDPSPRAEILRTCTVCKSGKPESEFSRDSSKASGFKSLCKPCDNAKSKRYYRKHGERKLAAARRRAAELRPYDGLRPCKKCGKPASSNRHHYCETCRIEAEDKRDRRVRKKLTPEQRAKMRKRWRERDRNRTNQNDYGGAHRKLREEFRPLVEAGQAACARCGKPIAPGAPWDLDHTDDGTGYLGPSHRKCNRAAPSKRRRTSRRW